jgi:hypothetical protein
MAEILVAVAIFGALLVLLLVVWRTTPRQNASLTHGTELVHAASLLSTSLSWDLARSHPVAVLGDPAKEPAPALKLPLHAGYDAAAPLPISARAVRYAFEGGALKRDGRALVAGGLAAVELAWKDAPARLAVALTGKKPPAGEAPRLTFELAAPPATSPTHWRFAAHHRAARLRE